MILTEKVEELMGPVADAIKRHVAWPSDGFTDIYNRACEAVSAAMTTTHKKLNDQDPAHPEGGKE